MRPNIAPLPYSSYKIRHASMRPENDQFRGLVACSTGEKEQPEYFEYHCIELRDSPHEALRDATTLISQLETTGGVVLGVVCDGESEGGERFHFTLHADGTTRSGIISGSTLRAMAQTSDHTLAEVFDHFRNRIAERALEHMRANPLNSVIVLSTGDF